jgi:TPR repeat protein
MSQRLLIGVVAALLIAVGAFGWFVLSPSTIRSTAHVTTVAPPLKNPLGDAMDRNDPGQQHFAQGRYQEAVAYWMKAAADGDEAAAHRLGVEYMDGKPWVLARDYAKSLQFHLQSAAAGNALSMFDIGSIYEYGYGVKKDIPTAAKWYGYSAQYGLAQGQYNYATMLEAGEGVAKDEIEAYKYFVLAARGGFDGVPYNNETLRIDRDAPSPTALLARRLSRQQIEEGRVRADNFKRATGPLKVD